MLKPSTDFLKKASPLIIGAAVAISSGAAQAQLEEIVVTATKRAASLQDVAALGPSREARPAGLLAP